RHDLLDYRVNAFGDSDLLRIAAQFAAAFVDDAVFIEWPAGAARLCPISQRDQRPAPRLGRALSRPPARSLDRNAPRRPLRRSRTAGAARRRCSHLFPQGATLDNLYQFLIRGRERADLRADDFFGEGEVEVADGAGEPGVEARFHAADVA